MTAFFGRDRELKKLRQLLQKDTASMAVIKGRRRIGKSRLIAEFGKEVGNCYSFSGNPPHQNLAAQEERNVFSKQLSRIFKIPPFQVDDWGDLFFYLAKETAEGRALIVLDEINWMGSKDPAFLGKLKTAWDQYFSQNPQLIMILCGSLSGWIEKNILTNTGFVGRISKTLTVRELPINDCDLFWKEQRYNIAPYEKFKILSITGGIPKYLEEVIPSKSAETNIFNLCFQEDGFLFNEFEQLFHDLFSKKNERYRTILNALSSGPKTLQAIYDALNLKKTGYIVAEYMDDLEAGGFVQRDYTWNLETATKSNLSVYRLSDNYARFYLKYIEPNRNRIQNQTLSRIPSYESVMGLQFENLVLNNRKRIFDLLEIDSSSVIVDNPYFQRTTKAQPGCQVDYMIQNKHGIIYLCEIKFLKQAVPAAIISQMKEKINHLVAPKGLSIRPVLIHVNGLSEAVKRSNYFTHTIDFSDLLTP